MPKLFSDRVVSPLDPLGHVRVSGERVLSERGLGVGGIDLVSVSRAELLLAQTLGDLDERLAKLEGARR